MMEFFTDHVNLITFLLIGLATAFLIYERIRYYFFRPKFKTDSEGFLMYKDPFCDHWWYVTKWDDNDTERTVTIHDTIRGIVFDYHYKGPGRYKIKVPKECFKELQYKNTKELHKEQIEFINREDALLKKILKNKI